MKWRKTNKIKQFLFITIYIELFLLKISKAETKLPHTRILENSTVPQECLEGFFSNKTSDGSQCIRCPSKCSKCLSTETCSVCQDGHLMFRQECLTYVPRKTMIGHKQDDFYICDSTSCVCQTPSFFSQNIKSYEYSKVSSLLDYYLTNSDLSNSEETGFLEFLVDGQVVNSRDPQLVAFLIEKIFLLDPNINIHLNFVFYLSQSNCLSCHFHMQYCRTCINRKVCTSCFEKYYLSPDGRCMVCPSNVLLCSFDSTLNKIVISKCKSGFYYTRKFNKCVKNKEHCLVQNEFKCFKCANLFRLDEINNTCIQCGEHCLECPTQKTCLRCRDSYYFDYTFSEGRTNS
jgi:hypothetical protein